MFCSFTKTFGAIFELVILGGLGFFLVKRSRLSSEGLKFLSNLVVGLFLPCFIFSEIIQKFSFYAYPNWWIFPLYSFFITGIGYGCGRFMLTFRGTSIEDKREFLSVATFQNAGYLPLALVAVLFPPLLAEELFIYIFLFLLGFNLMVFSIGAKLLSPETKEETKKDVKSDIRPMMNGPVIAILAALACVFFNISLLIPKIILKPMGMLGRCAIPLSILVVGGNLALFKTAQSKSFKPIAFALIAKMMLVPLAALGIVVFFKIEFLVGFLLILQAAMPPAVLLSVISKNQGHTDRIASKAIFYGHLLGILTIPFFFALFQLLTRQP